VRPENEWEKDWATLKEILKYKSAEEAFDKLVEHKADARVLENWLYTLAALRKEIPSGGRAIERRKVAALARRAIILGHQIERAIQSPATLPRMFTGDELNFVINLPRLLREYARIWEEAHSVSFLFPPARDNSRTRAITSFCCMVKGTTGRYHYNEVVSLLNAIEAVHGSNKTDPRWDVANLKQLMYRATVKPAKSRRFQAK